MFHAQGTNLTADRQEVIRRQQQQLTLDSIRSSQSTTNSALRSPDGSRKRKLPADEGARPEPQSVTRPDEHKKRQSLFSQPGDPATLNGFSHVPTAETNCAAYLGFGNIGDLRRLVISHYFLDHFFRFERKHEWLSNVSGEVALAEIRDHFLDPTDGGRKYPVDPTGRAKAESKYFPPGLSSVGENSTTPVCQPRDRKYATSKVSALAYILILMVEDLDAKAETEVDAEQQNEATARLQDLKSHITSIPDITNKSIVFPKLRTNFEESSLEAYNRALYLLQYGQKMFKPSQWPSHIGKMQPGHYRKVPPTDIPQWMRNPPPKRPIPAPTQDRSRADEIQETAPNTHIRTRAPPAQNRVIIDLTDTPEPEERNVKRSSSPELVILDDETPLQLIQKPIQNSRENETRVVEAVAATAADARESEGDYDVLHSQLEEAKLRLNIILLEREMVKQKTGRRN